MNRLSAESDTIAAIATPPGQGGIGIIRISGSGSLPIIQEIFRSKGKRAVSAAGLESHRFYYGHIVAPDTGEMLDEVMVVWMRAPHSYTREDVGEIHTHAGPVVLHRVLDLILAHGARLAHPGEFTKRAFLNGRIDLTQAEAVMDLIRAKTDRALSLATAQLSGGMTDFVHTVREHLLSIISTAEAAIDFPEEVEEGIQPQGMAHDIKTALIASIDAVIDQYAYGHILRQGLRISVLGKPNVGKSSLLNRLLDRERAIVTDIPGTTRDAIEEVLDIAGIPVIIIDTAGLHDSEDPIERIGIQKTRDCLASSDLILFMTDLSAPLDDQDEAIYAQVQSKPHIWVRNKSDIAMSPLTAPPPPPMETAIACDISACTGDGITDLKQMIYNTVICQNQPEGSGVIPNLRHKETLSSARGALYDAVAGLENGLPFELIQIDLIRAADLLGDMIGVTMREDILDRIFERFCIGK